MADDTKTNEKTTKPKSDKASQRQLDPKPFFFLGVIAIIAIGGYFILTVGDTNQNYTEFASCLAEHNATMYGFDACPHCNKQKNIIGKEAFKQHIDEAGLYVRCRPDEVAQEELGQTANSISTVEPMQPSNTQSDACAVNVGAGTPTWVIDGEKYVGEQSIRDLAEATGCSLPEGFQDTEDVGGFTNTSK